MIDIAAVSREHIDQIIHDAMMKRRDEPLSDDEIEMVLHEMSKGIRKLQTLSSTLILHDRGLPEEVASWTQLMSIAFGHVSHMVWSAKKRNGEAP